METNINIYNLSHEGKQYILQSSLIGNRLRLSCKNLSNQKIKFTREFTMEELKKLDKIFSSITTPYQALQCFDTIMKNQKVSVSEAFEVINIIFYIKTEEEQHQMEFPITEKYTSTSSNENIVTDFQNLNLNTTGTGYTNYDTNINIKSIDTTYNIPTTTTTYENTSDNYLQNIEGSTTTNNILDTNTDYTNYNNVQDISNQYQETATNITDYNNYNTYDEYQSTSEPVNIPIETTNQTTYETTTNYDTYNIQQESYNNSVPYITPADDITTTTNQYIENTTTTYTTNTNNIDANISDERINKLQDDANLLKSEQQDLQKQLNKLSGQIDEYKNKIALMQNSQSNNEIQSLKAENQLIKQQLKELDNLRKVVTETQYLKAQLSELDPLREKAAETDMLRNQLNEMYLLRQKVNELNNARNQLVQINNLNNELEQINSLKQRLNELNNMRQKCLEDNALKDRINEIENMKNKYEQELIILRESQRKSLESKNKLRYSSGMDSKQLYFEESPIQFAVKGDIIHNSQELELLTRKINKSNRKITLYLIYKATADSDKAEAFHKKCDRAKSTLVLVETDKGKRFGGYTSRSWGGECIDKKDDEAFIFSLDKMMTYDIIPGEDAIGCYPKFGPIFMGCQIRIYDDAFIKGGTTFEKGLNYNTLEDFELTGGDREFNVREIEVYEVIPS